MAINVTILLIIALIVYFQWHNINLCQMFKNVIYCQKCRGFNNQNNSSNHENTMTTINQNDSNEFQFNAYKVKQTALHIDKQSYIRFYDIKSNNYDNNNSNNDFNTNHSNKDHRQLSILSYVIPCFL